MNGLRRSPQRRTEGGADRPTGIGYTSARHSSTLTPAEELVAAVLPRLDNVIESDGQITARCPLHRTEHPTQRPFSLNVKTGLWFCHSGKCNRKGNAYQLAQELGVLADPHRKSPPAGKTPQISWGLDEAMQRYGVKVHERGVIFPIKDHEGNRCRDHVRLHEGDPRFQYWGKGRIYHALVEWNLIREWGKDCGIAYMVEGNRDWITLAAHGWPAIGILGVKNFAAAREDAFSHIKAASIGCIVLNPDNDEEGLKAAAEWAQVLSGDGFLVGLRRLPDEVNGKPVKDTFDLFQATGADFESVLLELPIAWRGPS